MKLIVGFGKSGKSVAQFLDRQGERYRLVAHPSNLEELNSLEQLDHYFPFPVQSNYVEDCDEYILSPGVDPHRFAEITGETNFNTIINDIELFYRQAKAPIIAVTGTNGKSTVVTLLTEMINASDKTALLGGNIGTPALDLLQLPVPDYYVLELSSYQIELLQTFHCEMAMLLNITPDHLERHGTLENYAAIKQSLLTRANQSLVLSADDQVVTSNAVYTVVEHKGAYQLCQGHHAIVSTQDMHLSARHDAINALFCLAACDLLAIEREPVLKALQAFNGLTHRCERVISNDSVTWINDSKATNIDATLTALKSFTSSCTGTLFLILGGQPKGDRYRELYAIVNQNAVKVMVSGDATAHVQACFHDKASAFNNLNEIVSDLKCQTKSGDVVLFSPGGASFDCYDNFEHRGNHFKSLVMGE